MNRRPCVKRFPTECGPHPHGCLNDWPILGDLRMLFVLAMVNEERVRCYTHRIWGEPQLNCNVGRSPCIGAHI